MFDLKFSNLVLIFAFLPAAVLTSPFVSYAALGDSYASGNGAGSIRTPLRFDVGCGRFDEAYPVQLARKLTLAISNLACAGSLTTTVTKTQLPWAGDSDIVSVQIGGNEADFFALLNACVHQWLPVSTCDQEVTRAQRIIESSSFITRFDDLIHTSRQNIKPDAILLVLGYARFFNDMTDQCDHATFSRTDPTNFLTKEKRKTFNQIVSLLNSVIEGSARAHGAVYVNIDKVFEGHRFCENNVVEPAVDGSWFFNDIEKAPNSLNKDHDSEIVLRGSLDAFLNLTRIFHPTIEGHTAITNEIVNVLKGSNPI